MSEDARGEDGSRLFAQNAFARRSQVVPSDGQVASAQTKGRSRERFDPGDGYRVRTVDAQEPVLRQRGGKSGQGLVDDVLSGYRCSRVLPVSCPHG